jgi:hypothetical protein
MAKLKLLSAALSAAVLLVTPAMARESYLASRHRAADANSSITPGAGCIGKGGDGVRGHRISEGFGGGGYDNRASNLHGPSGYRNRDVWGHWGTYYGPMVPVT